MVCFVHSWEHIGRSGKIITRLLYSACFLRAWIFALSSIHQPDHVVHIPVLALVRTGQNSLPAQKTSASVARSLTQRSTTTSNRVHIHMLNHQHNAPALIASRNPGLSPAGHRMSFQSHRSELGAGFLSQLTKGIVATDSRRFGINRSCKGDVSFTDQKEQGSFGPFAESFPQRTTSLRQSGAQRTQV